MLKSRTSPSLTLVPWAVCWTATVESKNTHFDYYILIGFQGTRKQVYPELYAFVVKVICESLQDWYKGGENTGIRLEAPKLVATVQAPT